MHSFLTLSFVIASIFVGVSAIKQEFPKSWDQFETEYGSSMDNLFEKYKFAFEKKFISKFDEASHKSLFIGRVKEIFDWNSGKKSHTKGINKFTDMTDNERKNYVMPETKVPVSINYNNSI
jgi:hypothetical protein